MDRIAAATPLTTDPALVHSGRLWVRSLATQLQALAEPLRQYDRQLADAMRLHPDAAIFQSFPGAGDALAPRLLAAFGASSTAPHSYNAAPPYSPTWAHPPNTLTPHATTYT